MAENIYEGRELYVTRFVGPADQGKDRQRWQFTSLSGVQATLTRDEALDLVGRLSADLLRTRPDSRLAARRG